MTHASRPLERALGMVARSLAELFLPSACAACEAPLDGIVGPSCHACAARLRDELRLSRCVECSGRLPEDQPATSRCAACALPRRLRVEAPRAHAGVARALVHALKYGRRRDAADVLARVTGADAGVRAVLRGADVIVPVPADPVRRHERGFNVAGLLAEGLADAAPGHRSPGVRDVLAIRRSAPQVGRSGAARRAAPAGAMRARRLAALRIRGRHVVLVDDVVTTGATLEEAARVLRRLGAASVVAVTCTRADGELVGAVAAKGRKTLAVAPTAQGIP